MTPIATIKTLNIGTTGLEITGQVSKATQLTTGTTKDGRPWSRQWIMVQDQSGEISVTLWNSRSLQVNETVNVSGKLEANNKGEIGLSGKLTGSGPSFDSLQSTPQTPQSAPQQTKPRQGDRNQSIERQAVWKGACTYGVAMNLKDVVDAAIAGMYFVETGKSIFDLPKPHADITEEQVGQSEPFPADQTPGTVGEEPPEAWEQG